MEAHESCTLFIKKGVLGLKQEIFYPTDMSWPNDVYIKVGPVLLKLYATQFSVFSEHPKLAWNRDIFLDIILDPKTTAMTFLSAASNVSFASYNSWDVEVYAIENNIPHHDFVYNPLTHNFNLKKKGVHSVSIAYRKI